MNTRHHSLLLGVLLASLCIGTGQAETIDPNKPLPESLKPDILYFNFDQEESHYIASAGETHVVASVESGRVDAPPVWKAGPGETFGKAVEFNYGAEPVFIEANDYLSGNHLRIPDEPGTPELRLAGRSFTLGAWIQLPENAELPPRPYKKIIGKGGHSGSHAGWSLQLSRGTGEWVVTLLLVDADLALTRRDAWLPPGSLEAGAWHHVAVSFDTDAKKVAIWFDGDEVFSGDAPVEVGESTLPLVIGENGMSTYCNIPLAMDEVFITSGVHDFLPVEK